MWWWGDAQEIPLTSLAEHLPADKKITPSSPTTTYATVSDRGLNNSLDTTLCFLRIPFEVL